jgi:hypothetical protein
MKRTLRRACAALIALAPMAPGRALAEPNLHATGSLSLGVSDNPLAAPSTPVPGGRVPVTVAFTTLRPGVLLFVESPTLSNRLRLTNSTTLFLGHSEANSYSNAAAWDGSFSLSRRTDMVLGATVTQGRLNTLSTLGSAQASQATATQTGGVSFVSPALQESLSSNLSPLWRLTQGLGASYYSPIQGSRGAHTRQANLTLSLERVFKLDAVGAEGRVGYAASDVLSRDGSPSKPQLITAAAARYVRAVRATDGKGAVSGPTALAALRYGTEAGSAELSYRRNVAPNLLIGQLFYSDVVSLNGGMPLWKESHFFGAASIGYQHGRLIDANLGRQAGVIDVMLGDVSISYVPTDSMSVSARYQHFRQTTGDIDPEISRLNAASFTRNIFQATITFIYPPLPAASRASTYEISQRVDQGKGDSGSSGGDDRDED